MKRLFSISILGLIICSCNKNDSYFGPIYPNQEIDSSGQSVSKIFIGCEGNFQLSNASLSVIDFETKVVQNGVFKSANNESIGDVLQSMTIKGDSLFLVLNNSGIIRLIDTENYLQKRAFEGFVSPRYISLVNDSQFLVTDLYANDLILYNFKTAQIDKSIQTEGWQEQMIKMDELYFIANIEKKQIDVLKTDEFVWKDPIELFHKPTYMTSINSELMVCAGESENGTLISLINANEDLIGQLELGFKIVGLSSFNGDVYVCGNESVFKVDILNNLVLKYLNHECLTPYSFNISALSGLFLVSDAKDYLSSGMVRVFNSNGSLNFQKEVGLIPQSTLFTF